MTCELSFTVGPVQHFVTQARRTRDLWAGSWLLSYLTECALAAAERAGGTALIPFRNEDVRGKVVSTRAVVGGMPNRFVLAFESEAAAGNGAQAAQKEFMDAWQQTAKAVWDNFVAPIQSHGCDTASIWKRQVDNFWELSWVVANRSDGDKTLGNAAAARKQFRNVPATEEPGTKCSLMGNLQEISGHYGAGRWDHQKNFWKVLCNPQKVGAHDFDEGERLCAVALIKRLFPKVIESAIGNDENGAAIEKLKKQTGWPSTAFFSALPWLRGLKGDALEQASKFAQCAVAAGVGESENQAATDAHMPWANIDAPAWFTNALRQNEWGITEAKLGDLLQKLKRLHDKVGAQPIPFYALLLMDGDSMGALLSQLGDPQKLSKCLAKFSAKIDDTVRNHDGRTVYAGGDDVLAMLPARGALDAADELARQYSECFDENVRAAATISGAIIYAHWKFPLRQALASARHLLEDIAKERTGRDALAVGIMVGSGLNAVWSAPWDVVRGRAGGAPKLSDLLDQFSSDDADQEAAHFNASYLYRLREQYHRLFPDFREEPGTFAFFNGGASCDILLDVAHAEYRRRLNKEQQSSSPPEKTRARISGLMAISRLWTRVLLDGQRVEIRCDDRTFGFDGWRVARFLKQIKDGRMPSHE